MLSGVHGLTKVDPVFGGFSVTLLPFPGGLCVTGVFVAGRLVCGGDVIGLEDGAGVIGFDVDALWVGVIVTADGEKTQRENVMLKTSLLLQ